MREASARPIEQLRFQYMQTVLDYATKVALSRC
jgi:hypothetical protein